MTGKHEVRAYFGPDDFEILFTASERQHCMEYIQGLLGRMDAYNASARSSTEE